MQQLIPKLPVHRRRSLDTRANILAIAQLDDKGHRSKAGWFENFLIPAGERPVKEKQTHSTKGKNRKAAGKRKAAAAGKGKGGHATLDAFFPGAKKAKGGGEGKAGGKKKGGTKSKKDPTVSERVGE